MLQMKDMDKRLIMVVLISWLQVSAMQRHGLCRGYRHHHGHHRSGRYRPAHHLHHHHGHHYKGYCKSDPDCETTEVCILDTAGIGSCQDVCEVNPCGYNAECVAMNHQRFCICPAGYNFVPPVSCVPDPCDPNPCGTNAVCTDVAGSASCRCPDGFTGNPNTFCRPDPCSPNPCGANAVCMDVDGSAACRCPDGFIGTPNTICGPGGFLVFIEHPDDICEDFYSFPPLCDGMAECMMDYLIN